jgi:hypothetical protein
MEGMPLENLGEVTDAQIQINGENWGNIREWKYQYDTAIEKEMESIVEA